MKSRFISCLLTGLAASTLFASALRASEECEMVVIFPGGPKPGSSGQRVIDDFVARLNRSTPTPMKGSYFNDTEAALTFLKDHPHSFVLGSTGFFLANRESLGLVPMATMTLPDEQSEQYFLVTRKGAYSSLSELEGRKIAGTPFFEASRFVDRVIFGGKVEIATFFQAEATGRPLSALRQLTAGEIDGVLLNAPQYLSLASVPLKDELETVFTSEAISSVGLMRRDSAATQAITASVEKTLLDLSKTPEGIEACKGFGVAGFDPIEPEEIEALVTLYEAP